MAFLIRGLSKIYSRSSCNFSSSTPAMAKKFPLENIKVVEFAGLAPGPFCGKILSDWGASVIRVDKPIAFDVDKLSAGKRSIIIDSKSPVGLNILQKLCNEADVLIDPYRPGVLERLRLGPDDLYASNPRLIYVRISGYGQTGPLKAAAGHDINYVALSGVLSLLGRKDSRPTPPINLLADFSGGGLMAAYGVAMALLHRHTTGEGQVVDCSMTEGAAYMASFLFAFHNTPPVFGGGRGNNWLDSGSHFYDTYETSDGRYMAVGPVEQKFYEQFISLLELDPTEVDQFSDWDENKKLVEKKFLSKPYDHWCKVFDGTDACVTPVLNIEELTSHELHKERGSFLPFPGHPQKVMPRPAPLLSKSPALSFQSTGCPSMGQHTREVLTELGYSEVQIEELLQQEVVVESAAPKARL